MDYVWFLLLKLIKNWKKIMILLQIVILLMRWIQSILKFLILILIFQTLLDKSCIHQSEFEQLYKKTCDNKYCNISNLTSFLINSTACQNKFLHYPFYISSICKGFIKEIKKYKPTFFLKDTKISLILGQKDSPLDSSLVALIVGLADGLIVISYLYMIIRFSIF